jgi:serine protease Do
MQSGAGASAAFLDAQPASTDTALAASSQPSRSMASTLLDALMPSSLYTGLEVAPLTPQLAQFFGTRQPGGLLVTAVSNGSPAQFAGLAAGDVLLRVGSQQLSSRNGLAHAVRAAHGGAVSLAVLRNHQEMSLSLQPAKRR